MKALRAVGPFFSLLMLSLAVRAPLAAQDPATGVNVTTWQQDDPAFCSGCVYRTGENLKESTLTPSSVVDTTFGQLCNYTVDGQIYGQPLVVMNVKFNGGAPMTVAYVVTQNGSVYAFGGTPAAPSGPTTPQCTLLAGPVPLLGSGETPVNCDGIGAGNCGTVAPNVGILSTPVIHLTGTSPATGKLFAVAESQLVSGSPPVDQLLPSSLGARYHHSVPVHGLQECAHSAHWLLFQSWHFLAVAHPAAGAPAGGR